MSELLNISLLTMGSTGVFFGLLIAYASRKFAVEKDEKQQKLEEVLPGANCGACGYAGCSNYAEAIARGEAPLTLCSVGGADVASKIGEIMGVSVEGKGIPLVAKVKCHGGKNCIDEFQYKGLQDCHAANALHGGNKSCKYACLGLGSCMKACPFGAIVINENGVAEIDPKRCTGCGICVRECPKAVIDIVPLTARIHVLCKNEEKGKEVKEKCKVGCIACKLCERVCLSDAIKVVDDVAIINYDKCTGCMACVKRCPSKIIQGIPEEKVEEKCAAC